MDSPTQSPPPDTTSGFRESSSTSSQDDGHEAPTTAFRDAMRLLGELKSYAAHYVGAKIDGVKVTLRNLGLYAALGLVGLLAAGTFVVTAVVLVCMGLSQLLAAAFDPPEPWFGNLIIGVALLVLIGIGAILGLRMVTASSRKRTVKKYEDLKRQQRADFGHDVHTRAENR